MNFNSFDLNLLLVFNAVYDTRNTSRAAESLGLSQPAVSHSLGRLRDRLNDPLFKRSSRGVEPTQYADSIAPVIKRALEDLGQSLGLAQQFDPTTANRRFRVVLLEILEPQITPELFSTLRKEAPDIAVDLFRLEQQNFEQQIRGKDLDIGFHVYPVDAPDVRVQHVCDDDIVMIARADHPELSNIETPDIDLYRQLRFVLLEPRMAKLTHVTQKFESAGFDRKAICRTPGVSHMSHIVATSDLVGHVTRTFANIMAPRFDLRVLECPVELPKQHFYMMWHSDYDKDPGHIWLRERMSEIAGKPEAVAQVV